MTIEPDTKDWTWVLDRPCPECGFDAPGLDRARIPQAIRDNATLWEVVLGTDDAAVRPSAHVWSPLEYACHVRDVHRLFDERLALMLREDAPAASTNWDQDAAAVDDDYLGQDPAEVAPAVVAAADAVAGRYASVTGDQWQRSRPAQRRHHLHRRHLRPLPPPRRRPPRPRRLPHHQAGHGHLLRRVGRGLPRPRAHPVSARPSPRSTGSSRPCRRARGCSRSAVARDATRRPWRSADCPCAAPTSRPGS